MRDRIQAAAALFLSVIHLYAQENGAAPVAPPSSPLAITSGSSGEKLAQQVCSSCHLFPAPNVTDLKNWREQILPRMETRLGVSPPDYGKSQEGPLLKSLHIYPDQPMIPKSDWDAIVSYYLTTAPTNALPQGPRPEITLGLGQFSLLPNRFRHVPPLTTMVKISPSTHRMFLGDDRARSLVVLDERGKLSQSIALDNVPIDVVETNGGIYVTCIGQFQPSEQQEGALMFCEKLDDHYGPPKTILKNLPRATQTEFGDFNGDGKMDFAMCLFGNHRGRFSWFENLGDDKYREHPLIEKSGAIHCVARDFNGDGVVDLALLMAQENECFYIFTNDGKGDFKSQMVFQKQPAFGHNYFEVADFNGDGRMDLLVVNGDNGEYESPPKNYHGLRIYLNQGGNRYEEAWFFPLNGATKAVARDFDGDGDLDIAAIAFFPDYDKSPRESFVYLENKGGMKFEPSTFPQCIAGRWISLDAGDVDGDGDLDIAIGSYIRGPTSVPGVLSENWEKRGPSIIVLKNKLH